MTSISESEVLTATLLPIKTVGVQVRTVVDLRYIKLKLFKVAQVRDYSTTEYTVQKTETVKQEQLTVKRGVMEKTGKTNKF